MATSVVEDMTVYKQEMLQVVVLVATRSFWVCAVKFQGSRLTFVVFRG